MANTFHHAILLYETIGSVPEDTIWVEIGSERGEGSTLALAGQAARWGTILHSVDIDDSAKNTLSHPALTCWVAPGAQWTRDVYPEINKKISLLYLDNFDWTWRPEAVPAWIRSQIFDYQNKFGVKMNNQRCQLEHLTQVVNLLHWLNDNCMIAMDDTFIYRSVWSGKCGPAVTFLKLHGFRVIHSDTAGTVMARGFDFLPEIDTDDLIYP
jgi:hypothetical protein